MNIKNNVKYNVFLKLLQISSEHVLESLQFKYLFISGAKKLNIPFSIISYSFFPTTLENDIINQNIVINKLNIKYIIENITEINSRIYN